MKFHALENDHQTEVERAELQIFGVIYSLHVCICSGIPAIEHSFARLKALMLNYYTNTRVVCQDVLPLLELLL